MRLSGRAFSVLCAWQIVGTLSLFWPLLLLLYVIGFAILLAAGIIDRRSLAHLEPIRFAWEGPHVMELGSLSQLVGQIDNLPNWSFRIVAQEPVEPHISFDREFHECFADTGSAQISCSLHARALGEGTLQAPTLSLLSLAGIWVRELRPESQVFPLEVVPSQEKLNDSQFRQLISRHRLFYQGSAIRSRADEPDTYHSSRDYRFPDSLRFLDHKKSARYGRLLTKQFESEKSKELTIALDLGSTLSGDISNSAKLAFYQSAVERLAMQALGFKDKVSIILFAEKTLLAFWGMNSVAKVKQALSHMKPIPVGSRASDYRNLATEIGRRIRRRNILVLLTDLGFPSVQEELAENAPLLCARHALVVLGMKSDEFDLEQRVLDFNPVARKIRAEEYASFLHLYWLEHSLANFSGRLERFGAATAYVPMKFWVHTVLRLYQQVRHSLRT